MAGKDMIVMSIREVRRLKAVQSVIDKTDHAEGCGLDAWAE